MDHIVEPIGGLVTAQTREKTQMDLFDEFNKDRLDFDLLKEPSPARSVKKLDPLVDFDSTVPLVPFTVVAGHHGGIVSEIREFD
jgi:hypothetical protein